MPDPLAGHWPVVPSGETGWLRDLTGDGGLTGFMPPPLPDAAWVLNAMYEHESDPSDVSCDEYQRPQLTPEVVGDIDLAGTVPGSGPGRARYPGPGRRRLRWAELARRTGDPMVPEGLLPSYRCFPSARKKGSWPLGVSPPTEGSMDRESWTRLIDILIQHSPEGPDTHCLGYYSPLTLSATDFDILHVRAGRLADAQLLYDGTPDIDFSPSNLWAEDRSWVACTDHDLWATKVAGPTSLVEALLSGTEIEAVRLPWAP